MTNITDNDFEEFLASIPDPVNPLREIVERQEQEIKTLKELLCAVCRRLNALEGNQIPNEYLRFWKNETYNQCYNWLYDKFFNKPDQWIKKNDVKREWENMETKSKQQWKFTLGALVKIGFIEQAGSNKNIEYKWTGMNTPKRELFNNINQNGYQTKGKPSPVV